MHQLEMDAAIPFTELPGAALHLFWNKDLILSAAIAFISVTGAALNLFGTRISNCVLL